MTSTRSEQVVNGPILYCNGMIVSNDPTTPNTKLDVSAGICRDFTNTFDINLGNFNGANPNISSNTVTIINAAANGLNGLDTGTLAASTLYQIFVIADATGYNPTGCIMSLSSIPKMPFGYGIYRRIGFWSTDSTVHFNTGYIYGDNSFRQFMYDKVQPTAVTAGTATAYTAIDLSAIVPPVNNIPVSLSVGLTPNAASDSLSLQPTGSASDTYVMLGQVAAVKIVEQVKIMAALTTGKPEISYKVNVNTASASVSVTGFDFTV